MRQRTLAALLAVAALASPTRAQDWSVEWSTIDGGGEIAADGGSWEVSGTVGQWDATRAGAGSGGGWELSGGFWPVNLQTDVLFRDGFES